MVAISRKIHTAGGSDIEADGASLKVSRELPKPADPHGVKTAAEAFEKAAKSGDKKAIHAAGAKLDAALKASQPGDFGAEALEPLTRAGEEAARKNDYSLLEMILSFLALGLPFLVDYLWDSRAEAVLDDYERLSTVSALAAKMLKPEKDGDISGHMNLVVGYGGTSPLKEATGAVVGLGEPFPTMYRATATHSFSESGTLDPNDFEKTAGVLLIDNRTGFLLSKSETQGLVQLTVDGKPVYMTEPGKYFYEADHKPVKDGAKINEVKVELYNVSARFKTQDDPDFRAGMAFPWRCFTEKTDVSWWGQCHASGMLGSMGVPPAKAKVSYYDAATKKVVELEPEQITSLLVLFGDRAFYGTNPKQGAGNINRNKDKIDGDDPLMFHDFVMKAIAANMPFNLESHSFDQIWNYPVGGAAIVATSKTRRLYGGFDTRYKMTLTKSNGQALTYFYTLTTDRNNKVTKAGWDLKASEAANGADHVVPDVLVAYLAKSGPQTTLTANESYSGESFGFDERASKVILDLYFASKNGAGDHVYAVRKKDGTLEQVSEADFNRLPR